MRELIQMIPREDRITADQIFKMRVRLGLTVTELGHKLGVGKSAVNHWEMGRTVPSRDNDYKLRELASEAQLDLTEL